MFKSYYVVWKQYLIVIMIMTHSGLNRTMQYGNLCSPPYKITNTAFKSYYVVWKHTAFELIWDNRPSLNRTMQYGNR